MEPPAGKQFHKEAKDLGERCKRWAGMQGWSAILGGSDQKRMLKKNGVTKSAKGFQQVN